MADPNSHFPDFDGPFTTLDEFLTPGRSLGIDYQGPDDHPSGENIMFNEEVNQFGHDHRSGKNIMLDEDMNQYQHDHLSGKNIMLDEDMNQYQHDHLSGKNIMLDEDMNQYQHDHRTGENIMLDEDMNQFGHIYSQGGTSRVNDQSNAQMPGMFNPEISGCGNPIQIPEWPVPAKPYACSCCQVLREIIHTKEGESAKFEIHGRLGMISHGILERNRSDTQNKEYQMFDFCKVSIHRVQMFLEQYCEYQKAAGYTMVNDPLLTFYQAVSVGLERNLGLEIDELLHGSPVQIGNMGQPSVAQPQAQGNEVGSSKRTYKEQKEKIDNLTIDDFAKYFHLQLNDAAKVIGVSTTLCKNICRDAGLKRWPFRKISKFQRRMEERSKSLNSANPAERASAEADIQKFKREIAECYPPFPPAVRPHKRGRKKVKQQVRDKTP